MLQDFNHQTPKSAYCVGCKVGLSNEGYELVSGGPRNPWNWEFLILKNFDSKFDFKSIILVQMTLNF
jgi:hypothetical protein